MLNLYFLYVQVRDSTAFPLVSQTTVVVDVTDVNDVQPTFPNSPLQIVISEETPADSQVWRLLLYVCFFPLAGVYVLQVVLFSAVDSDEGTNAELTYTLLVQEPVEDFYIDGT